jgi:hypothetical protein
LFRKVRDFAPGKAVPQDGRGESGMEKLTMNKAGSKGLEGKAASASQDISELLRMSVVGAGARRGGGAGVGTCLDTELHLAAQKPHLLSRMHLSDMCWNELC